MSSKVSIRIPKPCAEKWDGFELRKEGRFCQSCQKVVVDFTTMRDQELVTYLMNASGKVCGRVRASQLKAYPVDGPVFLRPGLRLLKAGLVSAIILLLDKSEATAQPENPLPIEALRSFTVADTVAKPLQPPSPYYFHGSVHSADDNLPLQGVNVLVSGTNIGTVTDADGKFEFKEKLKKSDVIVFSFIGYATIEVPVGESSVMDIGMLAEIHHLGEVVPGNFFTRLWWKVKGIFY